MILAFIGILALTAGVGVAAWARQPANLRPRLLRIAGWLIIAGLAAVGIAFPAIV